MVWKSALSTIVGGGAPSGGSGAPGESVNVTATKPRMAASGASLSYNSPARKDRPQTAPNTALSRSTRMNASSASSPVHGGGGGSPSSPYRGRENMGAAFNARNTANAAGKEFVLEEIVAGGDMDAFGDAGGSGPIMPIMPSSADAPAIPKDQLPEVPRWHPRPHCRGSST